MLIPPARGVFQSSPRSAEEEALLSACRGYYYAQAGLYEEAIRAYSEATERFPKFAEAHDSCGWLHYLRGELEQAIEKAKTAIACNPDIAHPYYNLGLSYLAAGMDDEGSEVYHQAITKTQHQADSDLEDAITDLKELRARNPTFGAVEDALNFLMATQERRQTSK